MEIDSKDLISKYFNKTRNIQEFLGRKTFEGAQNPSHHRHNFSFEINNSFQNKLKINSKSKMSKLASRIKKVNLNCKSR